MQRTCGHCGFVNTQHTGASVCPKCMRAYRATGTKASYAAPPPPRALPQPAPRAAQQGPRPGDMVCTACGTVGPAKTVTKGHIGFEIVLWIMFLLPGILYSIWRLTSRHKACPVCGNAQLLPPTAPMAQKFLREQLADAAAPTAEQPPAGAAHSVGHALGSAVGKLIR